MPLRYPVSVKHPYLDLPDGWNTTWATAKANAIAGTGTAWVTLLGTSYGQGSVSSDFPNKSFRGLLRNNLHTLYPWYGDYYNITESADFLTAAGGAYNGTPPIVINSVTSRNYLGGWGYGSAMDYGASNAANPLITMTSPTATCVGVDLIYIDENAGSLQWSLDAGAQTGTITTTGTGVITRAHLGGTLTAGTHTVVLYNYTNAASVILMGVCFLTGTTGIGFGHIGIAGNASFYYGASSASAGVELKDGSMWLQGNEKDTSPVGNFGFPTQPHLFICELSLNDSAQAVDLMNYEAQLSRLCEAARRGRQNASIMFLAMQQPDGIHSDVTTGVLSATNNPNYRHYLEIQRRIARDYNAAFVNFHAKWGNTSVAQGFNTALQQHPVDAGHADIYNLFGPYV